MSLGTRQKIRLPATSYEERCRKRTPRYFWEEDIDGNLYVYLNKKTRDGIVFGRTPPLCSVSNRHIPAKQKQIADFIVNALNEHETT